MKICLNNLKFKRKFNLCQDITFWQKRTFHWVVCMKHSQELYIVSKPGSKNARKIIFNLKKLLYKNKEAERGILGARASVFIKWRKKIGLSRNTPLPLFQCSLSLHYVLPVHLEGQKRGYARVVCLLKWRYLNKFCQKWQTPLPHFK